MSFPRFPDWARLSAKSHLQSAGNAAAYARRLEPRLQAFVMIEEACVGRSQSGPLALLPYAVKDSAEQNKNSPANEQKSDKNQGFEP